jgi:putative transposase
MIKAVKIRLYPTFKQKELLNSHFNGCRFIYNNALNYKMMLYKEYNIKKSKIDIINELPEVKEEFSWLKNVKAEVLQNVIDVLDKAFQNFFSGNGYPKFKNKRAKQSFTSTQNFKVLDNTNKLVFLKNKIKFKCSERDVVLLRNTKIKKITYSKDKIGNYFASVLIEANIENTYNQSTNEVGIDLGIKSFLTTSEGEKIDNPKFLKTSEIKLKKVQRNLSRKVKGSKNFNKCRVKLAKLHNKIQNQREYFLHKVSNKLISENHTIFCETLKVKNMLKNHKLAKSISDVSWSKFITILEYKSGWYGRNLIKIGIFEPSSKTCNNCGHKKEELLLSERIFKCEKCSHNEDRDVNAAKNIKRIGRNYPKFKLVEWNVGLAMKQEENLSDFIEFDKNS